MARPKYSLRWFIAAAALMFAVGCGAPKGTLPVLTDVPVKTKAWRYGSSDGQMLRTEHYEIRTTLDDERLLAALPQAIETAFAYYGSLIPTAHAPARPMRLYLFARRGEWEHFTRRFGAKRAAKLLKVRNGGYVERGLSVVEYVAHQTTFPIVAHEGFHQFLHHCANRRVPAWLNEGLAVLCEGQQWSAQGLEAFDPWLNPSRRNRLAESLLRDELFPLDELLRINAGHVVGTSSRRIGTYYAQLWGLMHFLREGLEGKYAENFDRLLRAVGNEPLEPYAQAAYVASRERKYNLGTALFQAFISTDLERVERELRTFLRQRILNETPPE